MFIDASAIVAILARAPDADRLKAAIDATNKRVTSPLALFEATLGLAKAKAGQGAAPTADQIEAARAVVAAFIEVNSVHVAPINSAIADRAAGVAARFGKVVGHPAALNYGECLSYASARALRTDLLFSGGGFSQTDANESRAPAHHHERGNMLIQSDVNALPPCGHDGIGPQASHVAIAAVTGGTQ